MIQAFGPNENVRRYCLRKYFCYLFLFYLYLWISTVNEPLSPMSFIFISFSSFFHSSLCRSTCQDFVPMCWWIISCIDTHHILSIHQFVLQLSWVMLLWTFMYKFLCGHVSFLSDAYLGVDVLGHLVTVFSILRKFPVFSKEAAPFYITATYVKSIPISFYPHQRCFLSVCDSGHFNGYEVV